MRWNAGIYSELLDQCISVIGKIGGISLIDISLEWKLNICSIYYGR